MRDPVDLSDGITYEREAVEVRLWEQQQQGGENATLSSPVTRMKLSQRGVTPCR